MKIVSIYKLRENLAYYLDLVAKTGSPVIVEKYNIPTAIISPYAGEMAADESQSYFGFLTSNISGSAFLKKIRRSKAEKKKVEELRKGR